MRSGSSSSFFVMIKTKILSINKRLIKKFGIPHKSKTPPNPVDLLIATILSQNTNDRNSYRAFQNLKGKFTNWEDAEKVSYPVIENYIKVAGLGKQKSISISNFLKTLLKERGKISLNYLKEFSSENVIHELIKFPGVGIKTASCVLLFSFERNVCPVDTHVHRTTNRIGIVKTNSPDKTFILVNRNLPDGIAHEFHTNLIRLGREICRPAKPLCSICPLLKICKYEFKNLGKISSHKENNFMLLDNIK